MIGDGVVETFLLLFMISEVFDDDDEFDEEYDDIDSSLESDNNILPLAISAVHEFITIGLDDIYVDDRYL